MRRGTKTVYDDLKNWEGRRTVEVDQWEPPWMGTDPVDATGRPIQPGDFVARANRSGRAVSLEILRVREVRDAKSRPGEPRVYLADSKVPVDYPCRLLVVPFDPETLTVSGL